MNLEKIKEHYKSIIKNDGFCFPADFLGNIGCFNICKICYKNSNGENVYTKHKDSIEIAKQKLEEIEKAELLAEKLND